MKSGENILFSEYNTLYLPTFGRSDDVVKVSLTSFTFVLCLLRTIVPPNSGHSSRSPHIPPSAHTITVRTIESSSYVLAQDRLMGQMDDSASDTSHDKVKPAFYKISPEEMYKMKHSLEIMENRLGSLWITTGRAHVDPILNEFELVKASITEAEPASENLYCYTWRLY